MDADTSPHSTRSPCAIAITPGLREELMPFLGVLSGSRFWPDYHYEPVGYPTN